MHLLEAAINSKRARCMFVSWVVLFKGYVSILVISHVFIPIQFTELDLYVNIAIKREDSISRLVT